MIYSDMNAGDMLQALGDDAMKWADAFCEKFPDFDHEAAFGWFANAIENAWDVRCSRATHSDEGLLDHMSALIRNRDRWREHAEVLTRPWIDEAPEADAVVSPAPGGPQ